LDGAADKTIGGVGLNRVPATGLQPTHKRGKPMEYEYKVIDVADGSFSSVLLGEGRIETAVLEAYINAMAGDGWRMIFMEKVMQRHLVISDRDTLMTTFERRVPEAERLDTTIPPIPCASPSVRRSKSRKRSIQTI